jgi:hypothetical protein
MQPRTAASDDAAERVCHVVRFNDLDAGLMHAHENLKRRLIDPDTHLYRTDLAHAIAAIEAVALRHHTVYSDPAIDPACRQQVDRLIARHRRWQQRQDALFRAMGAVGIGILLFNILRQVAS